MNLSMEKYAVSATTIVLNHFDNWLQLGNSNINKASKFRGFIYVIRIEWHLLLYDKPQYLIIVARTNIEHVHASLNIIE